MKTLEALKLEVLYAAHELIGQALELERALRRILRILGEKLDMKRASIVLWDEASERLKIKASYGLSPEEEAQGIYEIGEGVTGRVFVSGEPCVVSDVSREPLFLNRTGARSLAKEVISFIAVPIRIENEILGVLWVDRLFGYQVALEEDVKFLEVMAFLIAQFIKLKKKVEAREIRLREENLDLRDELEARFSEFMYGSRSPRMREVLSLVRQVAPTRATVLLLGESGTGKTLTARLIHELSPRRGKPFVKVNCAALPENLLEAELFGYEKGAFTGAVASKPGRFEIADGGTIFLDEIAELPLPLQGKLLRFIQDREFERLGSTRTRRVDVRIIAATNRDLEKLVREGTFREDLFYRLNVFPIYIPPLRERREDLPGLIKFILRRIEQNYGRRLVLSPEALRRLVEYPWPGNVRELENVLERLFIVCERNPVPEEMVSRLLDREEKSGEDPSAKGPFFPPEREPSPEEILETLRRNDFIIARAAREMGLSFRQLRYRIRKLGLEKYFSVRKGRPPAGKTKGLSPKDKGGG
ncbi:sigma 54-interacting transcriptional regulator [Thermosulfurimonas sp. F29]|uniref:sigma 54-interacting transcriptional regulator n=1 Tax=Thermosulfurimonas sp. F29 TaxID=2867247 RepID=UPI001C830A6F|nr:sigma 54-interacting transcriptional regulator [Thermosulfurimonas sp. F29]MBX6423092.1 sigma 54-interacting transcriptional regulator [Thermosulfurimonas sp. F29]